MNFVQLRSPRTRLDSTMAVRNEKPSNTMPNDRTAKAQMGASISCGWRIFSMPSYNANMEPTVNSTRATTKDQKYRSRPYPNGWVVVASRLARRPPRSSRAWLPVSAQEWIASASIEEAPVKANATNLAMAMPRFAKKAARIALVPPLAAIQAPWVLPRCVCAGRSRSRDCWCRSRIALCLRRAQPEPRLLVRCVCVRPGTVASHGYCF